KPDLLDHLVGNGEQPGRKCDAERHGGLEVDDELEPGRLYNRQVGRLLTLEDAASVDASLVVCIGHTGTVAHQTTRHGALATFVDCWDRLTRNQRHDVISFTIEEGIRADDERVNPLLRKGRELTIDLVLRARGKN